MISGITTIFSLPSVGKSVEKREKGRKAALEQLVARTRFELVISALRGRRPEPLDERAIYDWEDMAGIERVELPLTEPESAVLPLDDIPRCHPCASAREITIKETCQRCKQ